MGEVMKLNYKYMLVCPQKAEHVLCAPPLLLPISQTQVTAQSGRKNQGPAACHGPGKENPLCFRGKYQLSQTPQAVKLAAIFFV